MARESLQVNLNPAVLRWARESAGWTVQETAKKIGVAPDTIRQWESGERLLPLNVLEKLATYFKRPLAAFFLPKPPQEPQPPTDFRMLPGGPGSFSKKTRLALRRARRLQTISRELMKDLGLEVEANMGKASLSDNPEEVARRERSRLKVDIQEQLDWKNPSQAFEVWRNRVESLNILVFQIRMPIEDARGFSLRDGEPPAIVVNSSDAIQARIFTLFHEFAHILLQKPGICIPEDGLIKSVDGGEIEKWCNHFSGALLIPKEVLRDDKDFRAIAHSVGLSSESLKRASHRFKVSRHAVLIRMLTSRLISKKRYLEEITNLQSEKREIKRAGKFASPARRCFQEKGRLFISIVMEGKQRESITYSEVADYLSIRLKHLDKVQSLIEI